MLACIYPSVLSPSFLYYPYIPSSCFFIREIIIVVQTLPLLCKLIALCTQAIVISSILYLNFRFLIVLLSKTT